MKRSGYIKRKTPLKRSPKPMKRTRLKPASRAKVGWLKLYNAKKKADAPMQECPCPECQKFLDLGFLPKVDSKSMMDPHHPFGRIGARIMDYIWVCRDFHRWVHDNGTEARTLGWLQNEFFGYPSDKDQPKPWL